VPMPEPSIKTAVAPADGAPPLPRRQCGRCRAFFAAEPDVDPRSLAEWWACPPCRAALFPAKAAPPVQATAS
jgi:hypothetical protein